MKAAVCYEFGKPLAIEELSIDPPQCGEVKVQIAAAAICHSDVHVIRGEWGGDLPVVVGHESAGVVDAVGEQVTLAQPGDRVVVSLLRSCGHCFYCSTGAPHLCEATWPLDHESRLRTTKGQRVQQGLLVGAFAEYVIVDQSQVVRVPDDLPLDRAALLACGVITGCRGRDQWRACSAGQQRRRDRERRCRAECDPGRATGRSESNHRGRHSGEETRGRKGVRRYAYRRC